MWTIIKKNLVLKCAVTLGFGAVGLAAAGATAHADTVTIQKGDTVWGYSQRYHVSIDNIINANHLENPNLIIAGKTISIPTKETTSTSSTSATVSSSGVASTANATSDSSSTANAVGSTSDTASAVSQSGVANQGTGVTSANSATDMSSDSDSAVSSSAETVSSASSGASTANTTMMTIASSASSSRTTMLATSTTTTTASTTYTAAQAVARAQSVIGTPYVYGGNTTSGFDCSGLVQWAYGLSSSYRTTYQQQTLGTHHYDVENAPAGAIVFFGSDSAPSHCGISLGNGTFIQAPTPGQSVKITSMSSYAPSYYVVVN